MSVAESPAGLGEILTLAEAAAYLRVPEDALLKMATEGAVPARKIGEEWRFLKGALNEWLHYGCHPGRNGGVFAADRLLDSWLDELLYLLEQRLFHKPRPSPQPGSKEAVRKHFGMWKEDPTAEAMLAEIYKRRGEE